MTTYYVETLTRHYSFQAESDEKALAQLNKPNVLVMYKESETPDGTPFIILYEKE